MDEDEGDETWSWNLIAPGMDINMRGPTVSTHDGKEWVHINDYRRVKRSLNNCLKQKECFLAFCVLHSLISLAHLVFGSASPPLLR